MLVYIVCVRGRVCERERERTEKREGKEERECVYVCKYLRQNGDEHVSAHTKRGNEREKEERERESM